MGVVGRTPRALDVSWETGRGCSPAAQLQTSVGADEPTSAFHPPVPVGELLPRSACHPPVPVGLDDPTRSLQLGLSPSA